MTKPIRNLYANKFWLYGVLVVLVLIVSIGLLLGQEPDVNTAPPGSADEIQKIKTTADLTERVVHYKALIERVGPERAQEELFRSGLPFDGQTHLLNHTVGDYLFEKNGAGGLALCKDYFLSSCYHGFVLHAMGRENQDNLIDDIMAECAKKGITVTTQCSHAMGHGFLAFAGYKNLIPALKKCEETGLRVPDFPLFNCEDLWK